MADRLMDAMISSNAVHKKRLIDFQTGFSALRPEHQRWLDKPVIEFMKDPKNSDYWIDIFAYASKLGDQQKNWLLSINRAAEIEKHLSARVPDATLHIRTQMGEGESKSTGGENDDSPIWRAVEVHVFSSPEDTPDPKPVPKSNKTKNWSVKIVSKGKGIGPGKFAQINGVFVTFRNDDTHVLTRFFAPALGVGGMLPKEVGKKILEDLEKSGPPPPPGSDGFAKVLAFIPFNARMINGDSATFVLKRFVVSGQHWVKEGAGKRMFRTVTVCTADAAKVAGTLTGGPLLSLD